MNYKLSKEEKLSKLAKLQKEISNLEKDKTIIVMVKFYSSSYVEQKRVREEWDNYYIKVRRSIFYEIFQAQKEAMNDKNWEKVKELAITTKDLLKNDSVDFIPKPKSIDPFEFDFGVITKRYFSIKNQIKELIDYPLEVDIEAREIFSK